MGLRIWDLGVEWLFPLYEETLLIGVRGRGVRLTIVGGAFLLVQKCGWRKEYRYHDMQGSICEVGRFGQIEVRVQGFGLGVSYLPFGTLAMFCFILACLETPLALVSPLSYRR